jgi:uncharacterized protein DUF1573
MIKENLKNMIKENLKKISYFVFGLILVCVFSAFLVSKNLKNPALSGASISFVEEKHDFGDVQQGPVLEYNFEFTNMGEDKLIVKNVSTSCGCTSAIIGDKKEYMPGELGKVKVSFNTQGRTGKFEKTINVETNDSKMPLKTLTISMNVSGSN